MTPRLLPLTDADRPRFGGVSVAPDQVVYSGTAPEAFDDVFGGGSDVPDPLWMDLA